jgi:hypothetical protein
MEILAVLVAVSGLVTIWLALSNKVTTVISCILDVSILAFWKKLKSTQLKQLYLQWRYPVRDITKRRSIPSTSYRFPDGNGDVDKFINGFQKNVEWRQKYGGIYRIWNGMSPEMYVYASGLSFACRRSCG